MTRARCFALAVLICACPWGSAPVFAQLGLPGGDPASPYRTPTPMSPPQSWYGDPHEVVANSAPYGPPALFDGAFLRVEYLHWNLPNPGNVMLGSNVSGVDDPTQPFDVFAPGTSDIIAKGRVATTNSINMSDVNGIRATVGLDLVYGGSVEVGAFYLATKQSGFEVSRFPQVDVVEPGFPPIVTFVQSDIATSVLTSGQVGDTVFLYNTAFDVSYTSQLWGAEANWVGDYDRDGLFQLNPTIGLRYFNLHNQMIQHGVFEDSLIGLPAVTTFITSTTTNNLWGPQIGTRLEMITKYVNMGIAPQLLFLGNTMLASVETEHLRSNNDPYTYTDDRVTSFSFGVDVGAYAQINFNENFVARVGYNLIWLSRVTNPENSIYYNDNGVNNPPAIATNLTFHDFLVHGVSVGGELRY
jgi:hypothetical protein